MAGAGWAWPQGSAGREGRTWGERRAGVGGESRGCAGAGVYKSADGDVYVGEYKDDKKHGRGTRGWGRVGVYCVYVWA